MGPHKTAVFKPGGDGSSNRHTCEQDNLTVFFYKFMLHLFTII